MGYDLIAFSGGKAIRGPQCAGLLVGKKDLVDYALLNNSPHEDTLGRSQKVGKEEIVGMVKALELYLAEDHEALNTEWQRRLDYISSAVKAIPGVTTEFSVPDVANHVPHMRITWDAKGVSATPEEVSAALKQSKPSIIIGTAEQGSGLFMNSFMLKPGEEKIIASSLTRILKAHAA
jgi:L-seryl-tRNA(Ser) seleniumtransferase